MKAKRSDRMLQSKAPVPEPFPGIAVELVQRIVEVTARGNRRAALSLALVSKVVHSWVTPIIYHTVVLKKAKQIAAFEYAAYRPESTNAYASVRSLVLLGKIRKLEFPARTLLACRNLETLVTDVDLSWINRLPGRPWPAPSCVVLVARQWLQLTPYAQPFLNKATHVYLDYVSGNILDYIVYSSCLTHLGFGIWENDTSENWVRDVTYMLSKQSLKSLLIHTMDEKGPKDLSPDKEIWIELANIKDDRLLVGPALSLEKHVALVESGLTIWEDAAVRYKNWRQRVKGYDE